MPRESGVSSTPQLFDSIISGSGILDHPLSRMMTPRRQRKKSSVFHNQAFLRRRDQRCIRRFLRGAPDLMPLWIILEVTSQRRGTD
jgi:hypothetical protein